MIPPLHSAEIIWSPVSATTHQSRPGIDGDRLPLGVPIDAAIGGAAKARPLREASTHQPAREVELLSMFTVGMDVDVPRAFRPQQMHGVGDHHRAFVEVMLMVPSDLPTRFRGGSSAATRSSKSKPASPNRQRTASCNHH